MAFDWKAAVRGVAPALATALGGPAAGAATKAIANAVLGKDEATDVEISAAIEGMTPDQRAALRKADQDFALKMAEVAQARMEAVVASQRDADALEATDRANARAREIAMHDWVTPSLAIGITAIWALIMAALFFVKIPGENRDVLVQGVGSATGLVGLVCGYYFGTSFGSRRMSASRESLLEAAVKK